MSEPRPSIEPQRPRVLLFDIDGTLLTASGAGKRALTLAMNDVFGRSDTVDGIDFRGMTDALIIEKVVASWQVSVQQSDVDRVFAAYLGHLKEELAKSAAARALPGSQPLLDWISHQPGPIAVGLGTGNIEQAAYMKLRRVNLDGYFSFGGFGTDHRVRSEIIRVGAARGSALLGHTVADCEVIVIGDTLHDVDAALAIGARAVAVGTSGVSRDALLGRGASHAFETLEDAGVRSALLG